jgi:hypothetical protein
MNKNELFRLIKELKGDVKEVKTMVEKPIICKVWTADRGDRIVKFITVPARCDLEDGDVVRLIKVV